MRCRVCAGRVATTTTNTDPRPLYRSALTWVRPSRHGVPADRLADPTPCPELDVRAMLGHLAATVDRARRDRRGRRPAVRRRGSSKGASRTTAGPTR